MQSTINRVLLATGVSLFAFGSAMAQTAPQTSDPDATEIDDIVVTAQRRSERLIDVPVSVSVSTGEQLEAAGITNSTDLRLVTPALNLTVQGSFVQPTVRGVGTSVVGPGADGNVALYIDGVYQAVQAAAMFELNDIASIEVLKGPQGTLFGRNATGGAMVVTTAPPSFETEGKFTASYATFQDVKLTGYVTGPLSDTLAASLSVVSHKNEGYTENVITGHRLSRLDAFAARAKVLWQPTQDLSLTLIGSYVDHSDNSGLTYLPDDYNFQFPNLIAAQLNPNDRKVAMDYDPRSKLMGGSVGLNIVYAPSWGTITSVTSYSELKQPFFTDTDGTEMPFQVVESPQTQSTLYQEITFASPADQRFAWIAGANYYDDSASSDGTIFVNGNRAALLNPSVDTQAVAGYAEGNFSITDRLHFIAGGRYNHETKTAFGRFGGPTGPALLNNEKTWDSFTPRASLRYELTDQSSAYVAYSEGFKSGMFNAANLDNVPIEPEEIKSWELGYKYSARGFLFTGATYFYDYTNIQVNAIDGSRGTGGTVTVTNAGNAEIYGLDFDVTVPLGEHFDLRGGASYIHGEYTKFNDAIIYRPQADGTGFDQVRTNVPGATLPKTPEYTAFMTLMYQTDLPTGELRAAFTASYNDGWFWDPSNTSKQDPYTNINARIVWAPTENLSIAIYGENLTDELVEAFRRQSTRGDTVAYAKPRMVGIELGFGF